jgi:hypothetical protein
MRALTPAFALLTAFAVAACSGDATPPATETPAQTTSPAATPSPAATAQQTPATTVEAPTIPDEFFALYTELADQLAQAPTGDPTRATGATVVGAELLAANGNAGEALLQPQAVAGVRLMLDALERLGAKGVSVQIADPLLVPDFPRSAEYLAFYREVAAEVRGRGLLLVVEVGPVFSGTQYSTVDTTGRWPDVASYFRDRRAQLEIIAREIRPDYLSLGNEPSTETMLTGLRFDLDQYMAFLGDTLAAMERPPGMKVGVGTGVWEDPAWVARFQQELPVDFINLHTYPVTNGTVNYFQRLIDETRSARAAGKDVVIGESWLYKLSVDELRGGAGFATVFNRDSYSFWAPLDAKYIETLGTLARNEGIAYVSFFWSRYFFAYLDYSPGVAALPGQQQSRMANQAAAAAMAAKVNSPSGDAFRRVATSSPR